MLTIRPAEVDDATAIAEVQVETWRSAYKRIIPQVYLDSMTAENRTLAWVRVLERNSGAGHNTGHITLVTEDHDQRVVGFVSGCPIRHHDSHYQAEVSALYVRPSHQRENHGRRLFLAAANRLAMCNLKGLFLWVLSDNPARGFYEVLGGRRVAEGTRLFAGKKLREYGYGWTDTPDYGEAPRAIDGDYGSSDSFGRASSRLSSSR